MYGGRENSYERIQEGSSHVVIVFILLTICLTCARDVNDNDEEEEDDDDEKGCCRCSS